MYGTTLSASVVDALIYDMRVINYLPKTRWAPTTRVP